MKGEAGLKFVEICRDFYCVFNDVNGSIVVCECV